MRKYMQSQIKKQPRIKALLYAQIYAIADKKQPCMKALVYVLLSASAYINAYKNAFVSAFIRNFIF